MLTGDEILKIKNEVLEKLKLPHIWQRVSNLKDEKTTEVQIRDLQEKRYKKALLFLQEHYITQDRMCEMLKISSCPTSSSGLLNLIHTWMKDGTSLEAVIKQDIDTKKETNTESLQPSSSTMKLEDDKDEIVGLLVCRVSHRLEHSRTFSRFRIPALEMDQTTQKKEKESSYSKSETIIENTVSNETRRDTSKLHQFIKLRNHIAKLQATHLNISAAMRIITTENDQKLARKIGMKELASFSYNEWSGGSSDDVVQTNDSALLMAMKIKKRKSKNATSPEI
ncbi:hypothetical protein J437_LFUL011753 [Ladona fulva]|uniref:Ig-like domain-containing protein n=1 Tax=Ladona fulva TaxID=123851 RepID=A0A8K0P3G5_LADFU|nr:hypothetical protein J437_LFUL011753 [Ladona fulva]